MFPELGCVEMDYKSTGGMAAKCSLHREQERRNCKADQSPGVFAIRVGDRVSTPVQYVPNGIKHIAQYISAHTQALGIQSRVEDKLFFGTGIIGVASTLTKIHHVLNASRSAKHSVYKVGSRISCSSEQGL